MATDPEQPQASDTELVHAIALGDAQALAALYDRHHSTLFGYLIRILHNRAEAEDVLHELFLQVWEKAPEFDETRARPFTWLVMLSHSRAIDRRRSLDARGRLAARASREPHEEVSDATQDAIQSEQSDIVHRALAEIPEDTRHALMLGYFEGLSQSEIAARTGKPLGTVKTRMRNGIRKLRELLRDEFEDER